MQMLKQRWINGASLLFSVSYKKVENEIKNACVGEAMAIQVRAKEIVKVKSLTPYFHV